MNIAKAPFQNPYEKRVPPPILIALGYWEGDKNQCTDLIKLIVDLQPVHAGDECKFLLMPRQDSPVDKELVSLLKTKFNTESKLSTSPLRGYPGGSNGLFASAALHICNNSPQPDVWFWMEPDCIPMRPYWWRELHNEWKKRPVGTHIMGWKGDANGNGTGWHITGCALYDPQIARMMPSITRCDGIPWDYQCRTEMLKVAKETSLIHLCWRAKEADESIFVQPWAITHGYKDDSLLKLVRSKYVRK